MDDYSFIADVYDIFNPKEDIFAQRPFFEELKRKYGLKKALDCACGTGWHLALFQEIGLRCFGSDISEGMLAIAKKNLDGKFITLKTEDYRTLGNSWTETFDMVACLTNSLPHMLTEEDAVTALKSMYERINPDGILVITNDITDSLLDTQLKFIPARELDSEGFYLVAEYPTASRMVFNMLYVARTESGFTHKFTSIEYNAMRRSVLESAFEKTPFKNVEYFGSYDFAPYDTGASPKLIVVAQK